MSLAGALCRLLESRPRRPAGSLLGAAQAALDRMGWAAEPARAGFALRRRGEEGGFLELRLRRSRSPVLPAVELRAGPAPALARLTQRERAGAQEVASALCLLLESLRGRSPAAAAALERHERGERSPERILRTTLACNQRCPFCFLPPGGAFPMSELEASLEALEPGATLTLSGGEPTCDARLPAVVAAARRRGVERFALQTNATGLADGPLLERLWALGVRQYDVSFHSSMPATYNRLTGSRGLYGKAVAGLRRLLALPGATVTVCVLVNAVNRAELPRLVRFVAALGPAEVAFSQLNGAGLSRRPELGVDLARVRAPLAAALEVCRAKGLTAQRFTGETALPACLTPSPADYAGEEPVPQDRVRYADDFGGGIGATGQAKARSCRACPFDARCAGVPAEYARRFGLGALGGPA